MDDVQRKEIERRLDRLAGAMDDFIRIPGTKIGIGWDSILGVIPGLGDIVTLLPQIYLIAEGIRAGVGKQVATRMVMNTVIDALVGAIPIVGDVVDVLWKSNRRNADLIKKEIARRYEKNERI